MGGSNSKHSNKTHAFIQIGKDMKSEAMGNPLLLCGAEKFSGGLGEIAIDSKICQ